MGLRVIATGGEIDMGYNPHTRAASYNNTHVREMLRAVHFLGARVVEMHLGDGYLHDRYQTSAFLDEVLKGPEESVVVTQHSKLLVASAQLINSELARKTQEDRLPVPKTVALTGSLQPWAWGQGTEALGNFTTALGAAQHLPPGAYVSLAGETYYADGLSIRWDTGQNIIWGAGNKASGAQLYGEMQAELAGLRPQRHPFMDPPGGREMQVQSQTQPRLQTQPLVQLGSLMQMGHQQEQQQQ